MKEQLAALDPEVKKQVVAAARAARKKVKTVAQQVTENIDQLKALTSHQELASWAEEHDLMTQARLPGFKKALRSRGIDYEALRSRARCASGWLGRPKTARWDSPGSTSGSSSVLRSPRDDHRAG